MREINVEIKNEAGLHARPSSKFVELVSEYDSEIIVKTNGEETVLKSYVLKGNFLSCS